MLTIITVNNECMPQLLYRPSLKHIILRKFIDNFFRANSTIIPGQSNPFSLKQLTVRPFGETLIVECESCCSQTLLWIVFTLTIITPRDKPGTTLSQQYTMQSVCHIQSILLVSTTCMYGHTIFYICGLLALQVSWGDWKHFEKLLWGVLWNSSW